MAHCCERRNDNRDDNMRQRKTRRMSVNINPLVFPSLDDFYGAVPLTELNAEDILRNLANFQYGEGRVDTKDQIKLRYEELKPFEQGFWASPYEPQLHFRVMQPLILAKVSYVLGHDLGCVTSSGIAAEMLTVLQFELTPVSAGGKQLDENAQRCMYGASVERLSQSRRIDILQCLGIWTEAMTAKARELAGLRNKYLHRYRLPEQALKQDAMAAYSNGVELTRLVLGLVSREGGVAASPELDRYLTEQGAVTEEDEQERQPE